MARFVKRNDKMLVAAPVSERALHLGIVLNRPARILCNCGAITSAEEFLIDQEWAPGTHSVLIDDATVDGVPIIALYMHRDDYYHYNKCIGMLNAQESN